MADDNSAAHSVAQQQADNYDQKMNKFTKEMALPELERVFSDTDIEQYCNLSYEQLRAFTPEECAEIAYLLHCYTYYIQFSFNKLSAKANWLRTVINRAIAGTINSCGDTYSKQDERRELAIKQNSYANKMNDLLIEIQAKIDTLNFISNNIRNITETFSNLQKMKVNRKYVS